MIFDQTTASHLKPWLVRTLEPICDAEPGALADYILALLKHNAPENEMRKELSSQLEEFLERECSPFIDTLFTVLRTKSYLPYTSVSPSTAYPSPNPQSMDLGIPIPLDELLSPPGPSSPQRGLKRSSENDARDGRPPAKGPRLDTDAPFSRYNNGNGTDETMSSGGWGGLADRNGRSDMNGQGHGQDGGNMGASLGGGLNAHLTRLNSRQSRTYQPPEQKRGICRDYFNNGYCARGAYCRYSHGEDAVVPSQIFPMNGAAMAGPSLSFLPIFPNGVPFGMGGSTGATYDPHEARMDIGPPGSMGVGPRHSQRAPIMPRIPHENGQTPNVAGSGELPVIQDLTPEVPPDLVSTQPNGTDNREVPINLSPTDMDQVSGQNLQPRMGTTDVEMTPMGVPNNFHTEIRPIRGRGGIFGTDALNFRPERRNDKTLVVEKIPDDKLSLETVNNWFKKFGTVTNVAVDAKNKKALVSFAEHSAAHSAWKSEDAVFNNRFVKVFWHRPMQGHGQVGAKMLAASAPLVANMGGKAPKTSGSSSVGLPSPTPISTVPLKTSSTASATAAALALKQQLLERQISEQKSLMASLSSASSDKKKQIMGRLRKLGEEIESGRSLSKESTASDVTVPSNGSKSRPEMHEQSVRDQLDKELELHSAAATVEGGSEDTTEDLKVTLAKLKAEAASLGLPEVTSQPFYGSFQHPNRGRGRASRRYYRGGGMRGGLPRASMTLDNRPKRLLLKGVSDDGVQAVRDWYETGGLLDSVEKTDGGDVVVSFKTRIAAEQGLSKGNKIPTIGPVQMTWFTSFPNKSGPAKATLPAALPNATPEDKAIESEMHSLPEHSHTPHLAEEEVVASGWGGDGDDGDGMGML